MTCPNCGGPLLDMRDAAFNVHQMAEAGRCVLHGSFYTCAQKQQERDSRSLNPRQLRDSANSPWEDE